MALRQPRAAPCQTSPGMYAARSLSTITGMAASATAASSSSRNGYEFHPGMFGAQTRPVFGWAMPGTQPPNARNVNRSRAAAATRRRTSRTKSRPTALPSQPRRARTRFIRGCPVPAKRAAASFVPPKSRAMTVSWQGLVGGLWGAIFIRSFRSKSAGSGEGGEAKLGGDQVLDHAHQPAATPSARGSAAPTKPRPSARTPTPWATDSERSAATLCPWATNARCTIRGNRFSTIS